jgi:transposase
MEALLEYCAGLDVHRDTVVATVRTPDGAGGRCVVTETFAVTTPTLLALRDWLQAQRVTHVALESTGVYWKPIYYVLEDAFTLILVNMQHLRHVPGRKSDVRDSEWLAQLLECGLLRGSFIPPSPIRDLRDLTRYRRAQLEDRTREVNRLHKLLIDAGLKLSSVLTDIMGMSGRAIVRALVEGTTDPAVLADLARGKLRAKLPALQTALQGRFRSHHAFLAAHILNKIAVIEETIRDCTTEIDRLLVPHATVLERLATIPGIQRRTAEIIVAETGADMTPFKTSGQLCSWAGICPGQDESAGKRRSGKTRRGNRYLRAALVEAGLAATRAKRTAIQARYARLKRKHGHKKAVVAIGHHLLKIAFFLMRDETVYREDGPDYFERRSRDRVVRRHLRHLKQLGYRVTLEPAA